MNNIYLYRQILKGKWFIDYSYALSLAPLLTNFLTVKSMGTESQAPVPVMAGSSASGVSVFDKYDNAPYGSVAIVPLKNVMTKYGTICQYGTEEIALMMIRAAASKKIAAIVLDIDSGGGSVDSIPPLLSAIQKIQTEYNKPVVACADMCASAAYFVALHCDRIIAENNVSSEFGSIGVMMSWWDVQPYYEKEGYVFHKVYAPESTHKNLPFEKAMKGDYDLIKEEELSPLAIGFQNAVKAKRGSKLDLKAKGILNGRMFYAENQKNPALSAKSVGLIDEVASMDRAISLAKGLAEMRKFFT